MSHDTAAFGLNDIPVLLRGEAQPVQRWMERWELRRVAVCIAVICVCAGAYGFAMGIWRDALQACYTAIKFPLIILLTAVGNALLNGMLAPLLGLNLRFSRSFLAILMSFTIASTILGAFAPLLWFLDLNLPPLVPGQPVSAHVYSFILITQVAAIAFAGIAANLRLMQTLRRFGTKSGARRTLFAWLAGNLFLGSQLVWILRPFFGAPHMPVEFLRADAFHGNFFESVFRVLRSLLFN